MYISIPWIISRRRKLIAISIDLFIYNFLYNFIYFKEFNSSANKFVSASLGIFWILSSYVIGRYVKLPNINYVNVIKAILKISFVFILFSITYLLINWGFPILFFYEGDFYTYSQRELGNFFIRTLIYISILSLIIQYIFSIITYKIYNRTKNIIYIGNEIKYHEILDLIEINKIDINLKKLSNNDSLNVINFTNVNGIIIEDLNEIKKENIDIIFQLKLKGIAIENLLTWFEKEFHRIPTNIIKNKYSILKILKNKFKKRLSLENPKLMLINFE